MIVTNVLALICVVVGCWLVFRWGSLVLTGFAVWYFCTGQWFFAGFCLLIACCIELVKAGAGLFERAHSDLGDNEFELISDCTCSEQSITFDSDFDGFQSRSIHMNSILTAHGAHTKSRKPMKL